MYKYNYSNKVTASISKKYKAYIECAVYLEKRCSTRSFVLKKELVKLQ